MKNTRIYDRIPVKDVRVKDPQIGTRTPQILVSRKGGEYLRGDILDANATTELAKSIHMPDIDKINEKLKQTVSKDQVGQPNGVASLDPTGNVPINQLSNIDTDLFLVVSELPTEDIEQGKIYCIKDTSSTAQDNSYIEYAYINNKWEKVGEFKAEPDLSGYAKLSGATFRGKVNINANLDVENFGATGGLYFNTLGGNSVDGYIIAMKEKSAQRVFASNGSLQDIGQEESFVFTLEDGSTVTKSIRVVSTTNS